MGTEEQNQHSGGELEEQSQHSDGDLEEQSRHPDGKLTVTERTRHPGGELRVTDRTRHRRLREQGSTSVADLDAVLRAGFVCHLAVVVDGAPMAVPTVYGVDVAARTLYVHGSVAGRSLVRAPDATVCVTVTHVDGLVLARSVFEHGLNYRSAMVYGTPRLITHRSDPEALLHGLRVLSEQSAPGQWDYARRPSPKELAATCLLALPLDEASVKVAAGPPEDGDGPDAELGLWAGVIPMRTAYGTPEPDPALPGDVPLPGHIEAMSSVHSAHSLRLTSHHAN
ncbi:pyridoxamine 5'-phosphate oxidase family protein [Streptomyces sp. NPDC087440]|uniref:pyridoxamine 5'-phosphate oxidase family protein n=1 Tax=Streptomyces sp. NPDC087440 TaxID=3365790 RepID=UPI0037F5BF42